MSGENVMNITKIQSTNQCLAKQLSVVKFCKWLDVAVQTVNRLIMAGSLSAGGDRAGGPRGGAAARRERGAERARKKANGRRARIRAARLSRGRRPGPAETDPRPPERRTSDPLANFPILQARRQNSHRAASKLQHTLSRIVASSTLSNVYFRILRRSLKVRCDLL